MSSRAAQICKADLVSQVVIEFTKLQGVIGRAYALKAGEKDIVAQAIEQHYRPVSFRWANCLNIPVACLLAIADKLDTICGCFSVGLIPTGGADPYALRRQGIGVLQIMIQETLSCSLKDMIDQGLSVYLKDDAQKKEVGRQIHTFLKNRMINILTDMGMAKEAVNSAVSVSFDDIPDVLSRVKALDNLRQLPDFEPLSVTFKRVENIIKKAGVTDGKTIDEALFEHEAEKQLFAAVNDVTQQINDTGQKADYDQSLNRIATLRPVVDQFFEDVMVMADDEKIKENRLALLACVSSLFKDIGDFSLI
jgi:glycyl-tRNA synthetase beta chain